MLRRITSPVAEDMTRSPLPAWTPWQVFGQAPGFSTGFAPGEVFEDTAGATAASIGGAVGYPADRSGNGVAVTQATAGLKPAYVRHPANGERNSANNSHAPASWILQSGGSFGSVDGDYRAILTNGSSTTAGAYTAVMSVVSGTTYRVSAKIKMLDQGAVPVIYIWAGASAYIRVQWSAEGVPSTLAHGGVDAPSITYTADGDGWIASFAFTASTTAGATMQVHADYGRNSDHGVYLEWGQFEKGATRTAAQRRVDRNDITEAGVADVHGLYLGANDHLSGSLDLSGTDAVTICLAVSADAAGVLVAHGATVTFELAATSGGFTITTDSDSAEATGVDMTVPHVVTAVIQDGAISLRVDGTEADTGAGTQTGTFEDGTLTLSEPSGTVAGVAYAGTVIGRALSGIDLDRLETWSATGSAGAALA
ncbi:hypothetical protein [Tropicimonas marinistellae]|uniref:hypothetical protein n=1 Tax=Tropicimonas marinistellae TaxID=1739787 RepID=UPI00083535BA|nr:hypothetical protein [Tropicimonas marinistellae]